MGPSCDALMVYSARATASPSLLYRARRRRTTQLLQYGAYTLPRLRTYRRNDAGRVVDDAGVRFRLIPRAMAWKPTPARGDDGRRVPASPRGRSRPVRKRRDPPRGCVLDVHRVLDARLRRRRARRADPPRARFRDSFRVWSGIGQPSSALGPPRARRPGRRPSSDRRGAARGAARAPARARLSRTAPPSPSPAPR